MGERGLFEGRVFWLGLGALAAASLIDASLLGVGVAGYVLAALGSLLAFRFAVKGFREGRFTPDVLMSAAGLVTAATGYWKEGAIVLLLYSIAEITEEAAERLALRRLTGLVKLIPSHVEVVRSGRAVKVDAGEVRPGDVVLVRKGEVVPVDGVLLDSGSFDPRLVTGEPGPLELEPGDPVASGYINLGGPVKVRALRAPSDSTLQRLVQASLEFLERKGRIERLVESVSPPMAFLVLAASLAAYNVFGINGLVAVLVAGCPSAYLISASASTMLAVAAAARRGIVIKGAPPLEAARRVRVVVLDKTGTLTLGKPRLKSIAAPRGLSEEEALTLAASAAVASLHPLSSVIVSEARARGLTVLPPREASEHPGRGVRVVVDGYEVKIGSKSFVGFRGEVECEGPVVYVSVNGSQGYLCFSDEVLEEARSTVEALKSRGLSVVIASGDKKENVERVAFQLGVSEYYHSMKPEDKVRLVERLRRERGPVAMVGDGVNDVEALTAADLGVAVGNIDVVADVADAVVGRVGHVVEVLDAGKAYFVAVAIAFAVATIIKAVAIAGGLTGAIPLWLVAFMGDDGSTLAGLLSAAATLAARLGGRL